MTPSLWERLRAAPRVALYAGVALAAALALLLVRPGQGGDAARSGLERRLERMLSGVDGVSGVRVMVTEDESGAVEGVLIVCRRMDGLRAGLRLQRAVRALLDVDLERISVMSGGTDLFGWEAGVG